ncbi:MAG: hypothetical protein AAB495_00270 [Patescibacteria group bacterium]
MVESTVRAFFDPAKGRFHLTLNLAGQDSTSMKVVGDEEGLFFSCPTCKKRLVARQSVDEVARCRVVLICEACDYWNPGVGGPHLSAIKNVHMALSYEFQSRFREQVKRCKEAFPRFSAKVVSSWMWPPYFE